MTSALYAYKFHKEYWESTLDMLLYTISAETSSFTFPQNQKHLPVKRVSNKKLPVAYQIFLSETANNFIP